MEDAQLLAQIKTYATEIKAQIEQKREPKTVMAELNALLDERGDEIC